MNIKYLSIILTSLITLYSSTAIATNTIRLSTTESAIQAYITFMLPTQINLIKDTVNINTAVMNFAGIQKVNKIYAKELSSLGFYILYDNFSKERAAHLYATKIANATYPTVLLLGHTDTVYSKNNTGKFALLGANLSGPGVVDMKSGNSVILSSLKAIKAADPENYAKFNFIVFYASDEEATKISFSRRKLQDLAATADYIIDTEPALVPNQVATAIRSYTNWTITTKGIQGHSSKICNEFGCGAIYELARIIDNIQRKNNFNKVSINVGTISGGTKASYDDNTLAGSYSGKNNIIAPLAIASGDIRTLSDEQLQQTTKLINDIIKTTPLPRTVSDFKYAMSMPSMPATKGNLLLFSALEQASIDCGFASISKQDPLTAPATDIAFTAKYIKKGALSMTGPYGSGAHSETQEILNKDTLKNTTIRDAIFIYRLAQFRHR